MGIFHVKIDFELYQHADLTVFDFQGTESWRVKNAVSYCSLLAVLHVHFQLTAVGVKKIKKRHDFWTGFSGTNAELQSEFIVPLTTELT